MKSALLKDTLREMKKSFGRFISIFAIVGIGVAFFAGVRASVPVMKNSADSYYKDYQLMDIKIQSTLGLTKDDVKAIQGVDGMKGSYAGYSMDALNMHENVQSVCHILSMPSDTSSNNSEYINQYRVTEGRMPEKENECVIEMDALAVSGYEIGDTITFTSGSDETIQTSLKNDTYTIVGKVMTPNYLSFEKGSSTIGNGKVNRYIAIWDSNFTSNVYTEMYLTLDGAMDYNSYEDAYFTDIVDPVVKQLDTLADVQVKVRYDDIKQNAQKSIDDAKAKYLENKNTFQSEIANAEQLIADSRKKVNEGYAQLDQEKVDGEAAIDEHQKTLDASFKELAELQNQYAAALQNYNTKEAEFTQASVQWNEQIAIINTQLSTLESQLMQIDSQLLNPSLTQDEINALQKSKQELEREKVTAVQNKTGVESKKREGQKQLDDAKQQIFVMEQHISGGKKQVEQGTSQIQSAQTSLETQIAEAKRTLDANAKELTSNEATLENKKTDGQAQLDDAWEQLQKAESDLTSLTEPTWYVLDRNSHYSYRDYGSAADRMGGIAKVFPVFFFLVSALVCLTTMTRMVDEQRQEIGTLKALGYTKAHIAMKYIAYAGFASVMGGIAGAAIGLSLFPSVIYNAWAIMYMMPPVQLELQLPLAGMAILLASMITIAAAVVACYKDLMETPSLLMRAKPPKNGKKIILERIPFLWKHFSFTYKVTARNIFRYKKRFLMTIIGISGCTALLIAGFGIRDSIGAIVTKQYGEIFQFDVSVDYKSNASVSDKEHVYASLKEDNRFLDAMEIAVYHGVFARNDTDTGVDIYVSLDDERLNQFINLRTRKGHQALPLSQDGAIITEKLASMEDVSIGDTLAVDNGDGIKRDILIKGICENYVGHAIYLPSSYYKTVYHETAKATGILGTLKTSSDQIETTLGNELMKEGVIDSVQFYSSIANSFQKTISSLLIVVIVLIISAGLLAFVVLYNLTNVNISERLREIATIKVLGFYDNEVSAYVYRENILLTLIGTGTGLLLGIALHALIMTLAEFDNVMFGRNINAISFVLAALITILFAVLVNVVMYRKLKNIPMVESLKSIE